MQRRTICAIAAACLTAPLVALSQSPAYPSKAVKFIVPYAPGGLPDTVARVVALRLGDRLGQTVVVDNKPGASGNIGNQMVARAKPDGYTLLVSYSGYHVGNPHLFKQAGWDPRCARRRTTLAPV